MRQIVQKGGIINRGRWKIKAVLEGKIDQLFAMVRFNLWLPLGSPNKPFCLNIRECISTNLRLWLSHLYQTSYQCIEKFFLLCVNIPIFFFGTSQLNTRQAVGGKNQDLKKKNSKIVLVMNFMVGLKLLCPKNKNIE